MRRPVGSAVDVFEPRIRELLAAFPTMPAAVIAERVGWSRGKTVFADRVRELRPVYLGEVRHALPDTGPARWNQPVTTWAA